MLMTPDEVTWHTSLAMGESTISSPSRPLNSWWPNSSCTYLLGSGFNERPTATPSITKQRMPSSLGLSSIGNGMTGPAGDASIGFMMASFLLFQRPRGHLVSGGQRCRGLHLELVCTNTLAEVHAHADRQQVSHAND